MLHFIFLSLLASSHGYPNTTQIDPNPVGQVSDLIQTPKPNATAETLEEVVTTTTIPEETLFTTVTATSDTPINDSKEEGCVAEDGSKGTCVPYYTCSQEAKNNSDTEYYFELSFNDNPCESYIDTCCPLNRIVDTPTAAPPTPSASITPVNGSCGYRNPDGVNRFNISESKESNFSYFGEFPWITAILKAVPVNDKNTESKTLNLYLGGGSLIHPSVVLTGAHTVQKDKSLKLRVRVGEWDVDVKTEVLPHQEREVKEIVIHPDFKNRSLHNDIALLFLSEPVDTSPSHIGLACLPAADERVLDGAQCLASGWGKDQFGKGGHYQVILKRAELPVVEHASCEQRLRNTRLGSHFRLDSSFMCAGGEVGKDTCVGDGGSPLVCPIQGEKDRFVQNGIVAWGIGCYQDGVPGVYADVAKFRTWIDQTVAKYGYDTNTYAV